jgi:hypothetical protein
MLREGGKAVKVSAVLSKLLVRKGFPGTWLAPKISRKLTVYITASGKGPP